MNLIYPVSETVYLTKTGVTSFSIMSLIRITFGQMQCHDFLAALQNVNRLNDVLSNVMAPTEEI